MLPQVHPAHPSHQRRGADDPPPGSASSGVLERARAAVILEWHRRGRPGPAAAVRRHLRERLRRSRPSPRAGAPPTPAHLGRTGV